LSVLIGTDAVQVIDTRGIEFFLSRIPGSVQAPAHEFAKFSKNLLVQYGKSGKLLVLVHKDSGDLVASLAAQLLEQMLECSAQNMCSVGVLNGGFQAWEKKYATHPSSAKFITREFVKPPVLPNWGTGKSRSESALPTLLLEKELQNQQRQPISDNQIRANRFSIAGVQTMGELPLVGPSEEDSCQTKNRLKDIQRMHGLRTSLPTISDSTTCESLDKQVVGDSMPRQRQGEVLTWGTQCIPIVRADPLVSEYSSSDSESCTGDEADYQDLV